MFFCLFFIPVGCAQEELKVRELSIERDGKVLAAVRAEIAGNDEDRSRGLMFRKELPDGDGMLFIFENDQILSFWMKNTYIPLSIAYISRDGTINEIRDMQPHDETSVTSGRPARYALEVPQGWFARVGVRPGDTVKNIGGN